MIRHELIKATEAFLKDKFDHATDFEQHDVAYRLEHTYRVANIGREIAVKEGFDETEMVIACLLHDVSYCEATGEGRFWPACREHGRRAAQIARPFLEKPFAEKVEYVEKRLSRLRRLREEPVGTRTAGEMWQAKIDFFTAFYQKLADQLKMSESVIGG